MMKIVMKGNPISGVRSILSELLGQKPNEALSLETYLKEDPAYQNIGVDEIGKDLGFFTQVERHMGFPYHPFKPKEPGSRRAPISDIDAVERLAQGKPIELQPMRKVSINLSTSQLQGIASLSSPVSAVAGAAANAANANFGVQSLTRETRNGESIRIPNAAYLKLLYQLHSMDFSQTTDGKVSSAAKDLSFFTSKAKLTNHPWNFYAPERKFWKVLRLAATRFFKQGYTGGIIGGIAGAIIGGPVAGALGFHLGTLLSTLITGAEVGFAVGSARAAVKTARSENGEPYDELTTLAHLLRNQPVHFQQKEVHTFSVPFLGNFSWTTDYGKANTVGNPKELSLFSEMESTTGPGQSGADQASS